MIADGNFTKFFGVGCLLTTILLVFGGAGCFPLGNFGPSCCMVSIGDFGPSCQIFSVDFFGPSCCMFAFGKFLSYLLYVCCLVMLLFLMTASL